MILRLLARHRASSCATCGAELDATAVWCGSCGALVVEDADAAEDDRDRAPEVAGAEVDRRALRWGAVGTGLLAVAALALGALLRSPPPEPLLGRVGSWTGVTATGLPPAGLETVWERRIDPTGPVFVRDGPGIIAADGLVRVGAVVFNTTTGEFVRASRIAASSRGRLEGRLMGDDLVVIDTLTGRVRSMQAVSRPDGLCCRSVESVGSRWLIASNRESVIIDSDGAEVARVAAGSLFVDGAGAGAAAIPLRRPDQGGLSAPLVLVDPSTGAVVHEFDGGTARVAEVVGAQALVASLPGDATFDLRTPLEWEVDLIDLGTGESRSRFVLSSTEPPRLLGVTATGDAVVGILGDTAVEVFRVGTGPSPLLSVAVPDERRSADVFGQSTIRATVGLADDVLVVLRDDEVRGIELDGDVRWRRDSGGASRIVVGDGLVALDDGPQTTRGTVRVLDATNGRPVAEFPDGIDSQLLGVEDLRPLAVIEGHVGLEHGTWRVPAGSMRLSSSRWLDLRSGADTSAADLLGPYLGEGADVAIGQDWWLHGALDDGTPLLATGWNNGSPRVAGPTPEPVTVELPTQAGLGPYAQPIGAAADHLFVPVADNDGSRFATHVVSWRAGGATTLPGLVGVATSGELLVATEGDPDAEPHRLVGVDMATGERRWTLDGPTTALDRHTRHDGELLVVADAFSVTAIRLEDGEVVWRHTATEELAQPVVLGNRRVLVTTTAGEVVALDRDTGDEAWRTAIGTPVADLAGAGGGAVAGTFEGHVVVLDGRGRETQRISLPDAPVHQVASLGDTVVATTGRQVVGLRADGGATPPPGEVQLP